MAVKVAINGFGRIGRLAFRQMFGAEGFEIVAINDLTSPKMLAHLLKYDSTQGKYALADTVKAGEDSITVDGKEIKIYAKANAAELPWGEIGVDVVLECTGFYTSKDKAQAHIDAGAKHVIISAPAGNDLKTIVYNVNHETLTADDHIISAASCTTNCLAPMAKALNDLAPIKSGIMCTIHAYTGDQMTLDGTGPKFRKTSLPAGNGYAVDARAVCRGDAHPRTSCDRGVCNSVDCEGDLSRLIAGRIAVAIRPGPRCRSGACKLHVTQSAPASPASSIGISASTRDSYRIIFSLARRQHVHQFAVAGIKENRCARFADNHVPARRSGGKFIERLVSGFLSRCHRDCRRQERQQSHWNHCHLQMLGT